MSNRKSTEIPEHLFVKNPYTQKLVNLMPLFELVSDCVNSPQEVANMIQEVHDFLTTSIIHSASPGSVISPEHQANINYNLVMLRQVFASMREV